MTVSTDKIALVHFSLYTCNRPRFYHCLRNGDYLSIGIAMVKIHTRGRKMSTAIHTWSVFRSSDKCTYILASFSSPFRHFVFVHILERTRGLEPLLYRLEGGGHTLMRVR